MIFFRDQFLTHEQHIAFARQFGDLTPAHAVFGSHPDYPEIYPVLKNRAAFAARPPAQRAWTDWHTDVTAAINPPMASILRGVVVPPYGGDTHFCNTAAAYQALSPTMREFLAELRAIHRFKSATDDAQADDYNRMLRDNPVAAEHPLVTIHPETSERVLNISPLTLQRVVGLSNDDSEQLLGQRRGLEHIQGVDDLPRVDKYKPPFQEVAQPLRRLVLVCIDADFCNQILIVQHFSRSTRFPPLCTAPN